MKAHNLKPVHEDETRTHQCLAEQNRRHADTGGVSQNNGHEGFQPAYLNQVTGEAVPSRFPDGQLAPVHLLEGLPEHWILERDAAGCVTRLASGIVAGFMRQESFYTREEAAALLAS